MTRDQLEHVLRASAAIANETSFVVIGSQAVLLSYPNAPEALLVSRELDLYPALHLEKADLIDGAIGPLSSFHETFGYHADGVGPEIHDLAVSKCAASREKDADFVRVLLREHMVEAGTLEQRTRQLDPLRHPVNNISAWAARRAAEAAAT
jgi:hypothetical protein